MRKRIKTLLLRRPYSYGNFKPVAGMGYSFPWPWPLGHATRMATLREQTPLLINIVGCQFCPRF